ncbi:MAG: histidinol-phosphate transaminase [Aquisalimonadaceae bacterium]
MTEPGERIRQLVRPAVQAMQAYQVPDPGRMVKLDAMENPYHWSEDLVDAWLERLRAVDINRYPNPAATGLKRRMRETLGIPGGAGLMLGNGSDELIQLLGMALGGDDRTVLAPEPGFAMYRLIAGFTGMKFVDVPLRESDFSLDVEAMLDAIDKHRPAIIYLAYPNNPTGNAFDRRAVDAVIRAAPGLVVVDEAYHAFCGETFMDALPEHSHLLVMRTVSKMGLAGLRLGYLAGHPEWIEQLEKCRLPYNINVLTQASASFALEHVDLLNQQTAQIRADRDHLQVILEQVQGVAKVWPSVANFITFRVGTGQAGRVHEALREQGVLIKQLDGAHSMLKDCLRVTVGTADENAAFLAALEKARP